MRSVILALALASTPTLANADIEESGVKWTYLDEHDGATFYHVAPFVHASLDMLMIDKRTAKRANVRLKFDCTERTYSGILRVYTDDIPAGGGMVVPGSHLEKAMTIACAYNPPKILPPASGVVRAREPIDPSRLPPELRH